MKKLKVCWVSAGISSFMAGYLAGNVDEWIYIDIADQHPDSIDDELWESACEPDCEEIDAVYRRLKEYEDLEEQGSLVKLPCKYVYYIVDINNPRYAKVAKRFIKVLAIYEIENIDKENCKYFSTKEKAEERLKELRCNND